jgi:hypothetical protein
MSKNKIALLVVLIVVGGAGGYYYWNESQKLASVRQNLNNVEFSVRAAQDLRQIEVCRRQLSGAYYSPGVLGGGLSRLLFKRELDALYAKSDVLTKECNDREQQLKSRS